MLSTFRFLRNKSNFRRLFIKKKTLNRSLNQNYLQEKMTKIAKNVCLILRADLIESAMQYFMEENNQECIHLGSFDAYI